jgi:CopG-like RHH_1 or ribbon-helix-helix domain, RHH_5
MSKRIGLTVPDAINEKLERWAAAEGRPVANLGNFMIKKVVREADERGQIPRGGNHHDQCRH